MTAVVSGREIPITTREFQILYKLLSYPKKTISRAQLLDEFWGVDTDTGSAPWTSISQNCAINSRTATDLKSKQYAVSDTRRYCYENAEKPAVHVRKRYPDKKDEISRIRILDVYRNMHGHVRRSPRRNRSDG